MPSRANLHWKLTFKNEIQSEIIVVKILITQFTCFVAITNAICQKNEFSRWDFMQMPSKFENDETLSVFLVQKISAWEQTSAELTPVNALRTTLLAMWKHWIGIN